MAKILLLLLVAGSALAACASSSQEVFHSFDFGSRGENQGIEILNYRYGDSKQPATAAPDWELATGHIEQSNGTAGMLPVGNSLYVKWRVRSTGRVYEDTVDLKSRLPWNMDHKTIHFNITSSQLNVYVISTQGHPGGLDCPVVLYRDRGCTRIYPDHWSNF